MGCTQNMEQDVIEIEFEYDQLIATVMPVGDGEASGSVTFSDSDNGVMVQGEFEGLEPGNHGFHIHQYGDCSANDGTSAGGHFNPSNNEHGAPSDMARHMGDLGNIEAAEDSSASINYTDETVSLREILGRGIIIHAGEDDLQSQPTGDAGSRVACGVIGVANAE